MKKEFDAKRVELGTRIRRLRKSHDLSQDNFAEELDISAVTVSRIENGMAAPDVWLLLKMTKEAVWKKVNVWKCGRTL